MHKIAIIFLSFSLDMCFWYSKEPSRDGSFEYPQHMFWMRNKKNNFQLRTLIWGPADSVLKRLIWKRVSNNIQKQQKLAEDLHEISSHIWFLKSVTNFNVICYNILVPS